MWLGAEATHFGHVEETSRTTNDCPTREMKFGDRLKASFIQGPCAVRYPFPSFQDLGKEWVVLHALFFVVRTKLASRTKTDLELLVWREIWILIV